MPSPATAAAAGDAAGRQSLIALYLPHYSFILPLISLDVDVDKQVSLLERPSLIHLTIEARSFSHTIITDTKDGILCRH